MTAHSIDSAPRDGTPIFLWLPLRKRWIEAIWDTDRYNRTSDEYDGNWVLRWAEIDSYGCILVEDKPSHWMPLPDDPTTAP